MRIEPSNPPRGKIWDSYMQTADQATSSGPKLIQFVAAMESVVEAQPYFKVL